MGSIIEFMEIKCQDASRIGRQNTLKTDRQEVAGFMLRKWHNRCQTLCQNGTQNATIADNLMEIPCEICELECKHRWPGVLHQSARHIFMVGMHINNENSGWRRC